MILRAWNGDTVVTYTAAGTGSLIVLLPSIARSAADFVPLADQLATRGHRVLSVEPRDIHATTTEAGVTTLHDYAADVAAVVRKEGDGPVIICGHAYGNRVARTFAADYPNATNGVVLLAAGTDRYPPGLSLAIDRICDPAVDDDQRLADLRAAFFAPASDPRPWLEGWHRPLLFRQRAASSATDQADWWVCGNAPVLDLQGEHDPFRPPHTRGELRDALGPRVSVVTIKDASHALPAERPVETAYAMADWIWSLGVN